MTILGCVLLYFLEFFFLKVNTMDNWGVTNTIDGFVIEAGNTIAVKARDNIAESVNAIYWVAPPAYLSNKVSVINFC